MFDDNPFLSSWLRQEIGDIHSWLAGELLIERGMSPLHYSRRFAMTKMVDVARPSGVCCGSCPPFGTGLLKTLSLYREMVDIEIGKGSEHGARWWSRRLVQVSEEAGLVRLDR